jgi:serine/threonine protein phosphatase 1
LKALLEKIKYNKEYDVLYFTGDYVDRGPYSKGVLDFIMSLQKSTHGRTIPLLGNHEKMVMDLRRAKWEYEEDWATNNGGDATLESFGVQRVRDIPEKYFTWIKSLKPFAITDEYVIAHAGVNMKHKAPFRKTPANLNNMIWDRDVKPDPKKKVIMVVGHTPQSKSALKASAKTGKVYVDGGCARGGVLVAFNLETRKMVFQQNKEGVAKTMWR